MRQPIALQAGKQHAAMPHLMYAAYAAHLYSCRGKRGVWTTMTF